MVRNAKEMQARQYPTTNSFKGSQHLTVPLTSKLLISEVLGVGTSAAPKAPKGGRAAILHVTTLFLVGVPKTYTGELTGNSTVSKLDILSGHSSHAASSHVWKSFYWFLESLAAAYMRLLRHRAASKRLGTNGGFGHRRHKFEFAYNELSIPSHRETDFLPV